jgi:hypothetical protein
MLTARAIFNMGVIRAGDHGSRYCEGSRYAAGHSPELHSATEVVNMDGNRYYGVRVEGAKYGVSFGSALAIAISYTANHSILWAIIHGILGWLYVIYYALFRS